MRQHILRLFLLSLPAATLPAQMMACPSCFGAPDAPATHGLNMAILTLLGVTSGVFTGVLSLVLSIRKRSRLLEGRGTRKEAVG